MPKAASSQCRTHKVHIHAIRRGGRHRYLRASARLPDGRTYINVGLDVALHSHYDSNTICQQVHEVVYTHLQAAMSAVQPIEDTVFTSDPFSTNHWATLAWPCRQAAMRGVRGWAYGTCTHTLSDLTHTHSHLLPRTISTLTSQLRRSHCTTRKWPPPAASVNAVFPACTHNQPRHGIQKHSSYSTHHSEISAPHTVAAREPQTAPTSRTIFGRLGSARQSVISHFTKLIIPLAAATFSRLLSSCSHFT